MENITIAWKTPLLSVGQIKQEKIELDDSSYFMDFDCSMSTDEISCGEKKEVFYVEQIHELEAVLKEDLKRTIDYILPNLTGSPNLRKKLENIIQFLKHPIYLTPQEETKHFMQITDEYVAFNYVKNALDVSTVFAEYTNYLKTNGGYNESLEDYITFDEFVDIFLSKYLRMNTVVTVFIHRSFKKFYFLQNDFEKNTHVKMFNLTEEGIDSYFIVTDNVLDMDDLTEEKIEKTIQKLKENI